MHLVTSRALRAFLCSSGHFPEVGSALSRSEQMVLGIEGRYLAPNAKWPLCEGSGIDEC